jgi:hypothetical protein
LPGLRETNGAGPAPRAPWRCWRRPFERPVAPHVLAKLRRVCERWTEGDKALAHIYLAHAGLPPCGPHQALRLFVADELIDAGVMPAVQMKAQGFDLDL